MEVALKRKGELKIKGRDITNLSSKDLKQAYCFYNNGLPSLFS